MNSLVSNEMKRPLVGFLEGDIVVCIDEFKGFQKGNKYRVFVVDVPTFTSITGIVNNQGAMVVTPDGNQKHGYWVHHPDVYKHFRLSSTKSHLPEWL